jgi:hypothetical protein
MSRRRWAKPTRKEVFDFLHKTPSIEDDGALPSFRVEIWNSHEWVTVHDEAMYWQCRLLKRALVGVGFNARVQLNGEPE